MFRRLLVLVLLFCLTVITGTGNADDHYKLYLVRHSEKLLDDGDDPGLTEEGNQRSIKLAGWLRDKGIEDIWSSDYRRSRDTAAPLAAMLGLPLELYDPRDLPALVDELRGKQRIALVVGHSNTTPDLARLLCVCFISDMDDSDYDQLIVVTLSGEDRSVETLSQDALFPAPDSP
jgi:phosphohistidine phosphatase SixA